MHVGVSSPKTQYSKPARRPTVLEKAAEPKKRAWWLERPIG